MLHGLAHIVTDFIKAFNKTSYHHTYALKKFSTKKNFPLPVVGGFLDIVLVNRNELG